MEEENKESEIKENKVEVTVPNVNPDLIGKIDTSEIFTMAAKDNLDESNYDSENEIAETVNNFVKDIADGTGISVERLQGTKFGNQENPVESILSRIKNTFDFTGDNKVDFEDLKSFLKNLAGTLFLIYLVIFSLEQEEILDMFNSGIWDWSYFYNNIVIVGFSTAGTYIFNLLKKRWFIQDAVTQDYKSKFESLQMDFNELKYQINLKIKNMENEHQLEIMEKDITIRAKDELTRVEIVKNEIIEFIKVNFIEKKEVVN